MGVSQPTNFVHQVHVGFDPISGGFTVSLSGSTQAVADDQGLPPQWSKLLTSSAITKEEAARNPEAVIDVLQFYTHQMSGNAGDYQAPSIPTLPAPGRTTSSAAMRFEGVGLAGQQQQQSQYSQQQQQQQQQERERERERLAMQQRERDREEDRRREAETERERQAARERERQREAERSREEERSRSHSQASSSRHQQRPSEPRAEVSIRLS
jgi:protein-serine/threonine kinase